MNARNVNYPSTEEQRNGNEIYSGKKYEYDELFRKS
jgi:hypothetical protein